VAAALAGQPSGEAVLSIHLATDGEVDTALQEAVRAGGVVVKPATTPFYQLGTDGRPEIP
jgi:uncharacterized glyoxalase superfamily protein PhnB